MARPLVIQRFVPAKESTTSDSQVGIGSSTAEVDNLAAIIRNNIIVFDNPLALASGANGLAMEEDTAGANS